MEEVKGLYAENHKTLEKETDDDTAEWKHAPCSWIGRTDIVSTSSVHKGSIRLMQSLPKRQRHLFSQQQ